ncbi:alpha/beta hydrolase [Thiohalocapsa marina]|uniref:Alpha/beta hydrolase n=1 Tax=Thiohalocapsa marina TaxID=424902 RepID=A0A5M8FU68_9GAMM|nr:alpha/beta hydrolase [Thiohalocapsa marina]KAA6187352.1 alpha/beta hydrolase [Thiohalocapsa marina]
MVGIAIPVITGCASPATKTERVAADSGMTGLLLVGSAFSHSAFFAEGRGDDLHVYLSGDGSPWIDEHRIAKDPTPRNPVALRLMALDPRPRLYLGRPCYHGLTDSSACDPWLWTNGRYSEEVVASMTHALEEFIQQQDFRNVVLIGYSGGGVLAWLIAERLEQVRLLVTLAANLDTDAWTARHGYTPLLGSLNPAKRAALPARVRQLHIAGERDANVPPALIQTALNSAGSQAIVQVLASDHRCGWQDHWPSVLRAISRIREGQRDP